MFSLVDWIVFGTGFLILLFWLYLFFTGLKHAGMFDTLEEKEYPLKEVYFVGYAFMELIHYKYKSKKDRKLRKEVSVLYGEKYAEYYLRVTYSQQITISSILLIFAFIF